MKRNIFSIFCRSVGPGGTSVDFYLGKDGLEAVWTNENCPYDTGSEIDNDTNAASDGHNVSFIPWSEIETVMAYRPNPKKPGLNPQPKRILNRKK